MNPFIGNLVLLMIKIMALSSFVILTYKIFRIPIKKNHQSIALTGFILGLVGFYIKNILQSPLYFVYLIVAFAVVLLVTRRYPILYCLLISLTGFASSTIVDSTISYSMLGLNLATINEMKYDFIVNVVLNLTYGFICLLIALVLHKSNLGFSFVVRRFSSTKNILKLNNFLWAILLITGTLLAHIFLVYESSSYHTWLLILILIVFSSSIIYAYFENKKVLKDRFRR
ncbi:hypothetical protein ABH899_004952 [Paenibacillus sp. RC84]